MLRSNYVCAGFETLSSILDAFMSGKKGSWNDNFTREDINQFFSNTCGGFLHSFGQHIKNTKNYDKYLQSEINLFKKCRNTGFFDNSEFFADSGGYQISVSGLSEYESNRLIDTYYTFLRYHHDVVDRGFILDIPPGPNCKVFDNFKQVYEKNLESYTIAKNLPDESRNKVVYIHHFRTPKLWNIYTRILREENMFPYFNYFGTGGVVANMRSDILIPCIIYILPLIPLLNEAKKHGRKELHFHVLGGSGFRDILFYEFFRYHIKQKHDIDLHITYDSSGLFKGLMIGRLIYLLDGDKIRKISVRSADLEKRFDNNRRIIDLFKESFEVFFHRHKGLKRVNIDLDSFYSKETGTFYEDIKVYLMLYMLDAYSRIQEEMRNFVYDVYPLYDSGDLEGFNNRIREETKNINYGKITKKQTAKANIVIKSLDMLTSLDEDQCKYMVNKYLSQDEFTELTNRKTLTI